jgi:GTP-binding protein EngB required for normal cell division
MFRNETEAKEKLGKLYGDAIAFMNTNGKKEVAIQFEQKREMINAGRYQIALIGFMKRGKSTLLNALLGRSDLAPARLLVCTAAVVKYIDKSMRPDKKDEEGARVFFRDGATRDIPISELSQYVDNKNNPQENGKNSKNVDYIEVYSTFPLIGNVACMVDSPGQGSVYEEHDVLSNEILPMSDVIIMPVDAAIPLEHDEREFLRKLDGQTKSKILFVLTKTDKQAGEIGKLENYVREELAKIEIHPEKIYKTAAKTLIDARNAGSTDLERVKQESGMAELEAVIEQKVEEDAPLFKMLNAAAGDLIEYMRVEQQESASRLNAYSADIKETTERKKELDKMIIETKKIYRNNTKKFKEKWTAEVRKFIPRLDRVKPGIITQLQNETERKTLLHLIGYTNGLMHKVQSLLGPELSSEITGLEEKLTAIVTQFSKDMDEEVSISVIGKYGKDIGGQILGEAKTLAGGGVIIGGTLWGLNSALTAVGTVGSAAGGVVNALTVAKNAAAAADLAGKIAGTATSAKNLGILGTIWQAFVGAGSNAAVQGATAAEIAAANAAAAVGTATSGLVTTIGGALIPIALGIIVPQIAFRIGNGFAKNSMLNQIPQMVDKQLAEAATALQESLEKICDNFIDNFEDKYNTQIDEFLEEEAELVQKIKDNDPSEKAKLEKNKEKAESLIASLTALENQLQVS